MKHETELRFRQLMKKIDCYNNISNSLSTQMKATGEVMSPPQRSTGAIPWDFWQMKYTD